MRKRSVRGRPVGYGYIRIPGRRLHDAGPHNMRVGPWIHAAGSRSDLENTGTPATLAQRHSSGVGLDRARD